MQHLSVERNDAFFDVLGGFVSDLGQVRHTVEWLVIDEEIDLVRRCIVIEQNLPL